MDEPRGQGHGAPGRLRRIAETDSCPIAAMAHETQPFFGIQFHPEVTHTLQGRRILERFVREICACEALWTPARIVEDAIARVRETVGD
jgi:GMP synthase (glutamine-hydrolysing)